MKRSKPLWGAATREAAGWGRGWLWGALGMVAPLVMSFGGAASASCPVYINAHDVRPVWPAPPRARWAAFRVEKKGPKHSWQRVPLQIDPRLANGRLRFSAGPQSFADEPLSGDDRLVIARESFGLRRKASAALPCGAKTAYEMKLKQNPPAYVYLMACAQDSSPPSETPVQHSSADHLVKAKTYQFVYNESNHVLFDRIEARGASEEAALLPVATSSDLVIRNNMRRFFNLNFTSQDIETEFKHARHGELGFVGSLAFFLRILFFKINLKLSTDLSFFARSVHVPMVLHVPVDGRKLVYPGSGLLYSWRRTEAIAYNLATSRIPRRSADKAVNQDVKAMVQRGVPFCEQDTCRYLLRGSFANQSFSMRFVLPRSVVERGFFPQVVDDVKQFRRQIDWPKGLVKEEEDRIGTYFEASGLAAGEYRWDLWIVLGADSQTESCPAAAVRS